MKKLLALALAALIVCALPVVALAADSPVAQKEFAVSVQKGAFDGEAKTQITVKENGEITVTALKTGKFNGWKLYVKEGVSEKPLTVGSVDTAAAVKYVEAKAGVDYKIVKGSLTSDSLTFVAMNDIVVCGNYDGKITDPVTGEQNENAPKTGSNAALYVIVCVLALAGAGVATKKVLA